MYLNNSRGFLFFFLDTRGDTRLDTPLDIFIAAFLATLLDTRLDAFLATLLDRRRRRRGHWGVKPRGLHILQNNKI